MRLEYVWTFASVGLWLLIVYAVLTVFGFDAASAFLSDTQAAFLAKAWDTIGGWL